jgi:hypothetical protein
MLRPVRKRWRALHRRAVLGSHRELGEMYGSNSEFVPPQSCPNSAAAWYRHQRIELEIDGLAPDRAIVLKVGIGNQPAVLLHAGHDAVAIMLA